MPKAKSRVAEIDALALLKRDHDEVRERLSQLHETSERAVARREERLQTIERELKVHSKIEEEIFYPAFRGAAKKKGDKKLYYEAVEEHHVVDVVLAELKGIAPTAEEFAAKVKVLKDLVEHHAEEEEAAMFPRARKLMDHETLLHLGAELAQAKTSLTEGILTKLLELVRP